jgi:hypothetical protein
MYLKNNMKPETEFQNILLSNNINATRACVYTTEDLFLVDKNKEIGHCYKE